LPLILKPSVAPLRQSEHAIVASAPINSDVPFGHRTLEKRVKESWSPVLGLLEILGNRGLRAVAALPRYDAK
jgi:hypothetical protein